MVRTGVREGGRQLPPPTASQAPLGAPRPQAGPAGSEGVWVRAGSLREPQVTPSWCQAREGESKGLPPHSFHIPTSCHRRWPSPAAATTLHPVHGAGGRPWAARPVTLPLPFLQAGLLSLTQVPPHPAASRRVGKHGRGGRALQAPGIAAASDAGAQWGFGSAAVSCLCIDRLSLSLTSLLMK